MRRAAASLATATARRASSSSSSSSAAPAPTPLYAVTLLERLPVVAPPPPAWAAAAADAAADRATATRRALPDLAPAEAGAVDAAAATAAGWAPAPRRTAADEAGDRGSLARALEERVFMVVRTGGAETGASLLPSTPHAGDEPMRAAAERALADAVTGGDPYFVGNAPAGHAPGAAPDGGSFFFHRAQLVAGAPLPTAPGVRLEWLTKGELVEAVGGEGSAVGGVLARML
jgi:large subunit ribosomal protein L46